MADAVGQLLNVLLNGRYLITREIGRGGMATVYLARDQRDDRDVAIKVLLPDVGMALGSQRFLREIAVASRFSHPRILPLYDSGEHDGQLYYVMPFIAGESLARAPRPVGTAQTSTMPCFSRPKQPMRSSTRTSRASCTATSSRRTS